MKIGNETIEPGMKVRFGLPVAITPGGGSITIPVIVAHGRKPGPRMLVISGVHGDEYEGAEALRDVWRDLDTESLAGVYIGVPILNELAYEAGQRCTPLDGVNLNRAFPGRANGSVSARMAAIMMQQILPECDFALDLHGGGNELDILPLVSYARGLEPAMQQQLEALAHDTGLEIVWFQSAGLPGSFTTEASRHGKPAVMIEIGGQGRCLEEDVQRTRAVIENVMRARDMVEGAPAQHRPASSFVGDFIPANHGGLFRTVRKTGDVVAKGDIVGLVKDMMGDLVEEIRARVPGKILSQRTFGLVRCGESTVLVGRPEKG